MKGKPKYTVKVEIAENAIPADEALARLAKLIAREMYEDMHPETREVKEV